MFTLGRGGWDGWHATTPQASKNLSTPLEPKIRDLQKIWPEKRGKIGILKFFLFIFVVFEVKSLPFFVDKTCVSFSLIFTIFQFS